jgi:hypothetical protein
MIDMQEIRPVVSHSPSHTNNDNDGPDCDEYSGQIVILRHESTNYDYEFRSGISEVIDKQ